MDLNLVPVASTSIAAAGYEAGCLFIAFRAGGVYRYDGGPEAVAYAFGQSPSKGRYYQSFIRGRYPSARVG